MRGAEPQARGCDFCRDRMPSSATPPESVQKETRGWRRAARTSSSLILKVTRAVLPRSAMSRSMSASSGSLPSSRAICSMVFPSCFFSSGLRTLVTRMSVPRPGHSPPAAMSRGTRARASASRSRGTSFSLPPSRAHVGRDAERSLELAVQGYWSAVTSRPSARARSMRFRMASIRPQLRRAEALRWYISAGIRASRAVRNTPSRLPSIPGPFRSAPSPRRGGRAGPPGRAAPLARAGSPPVRRHERAEVDGRPRPPEGLAVSAEGGPVGLHAVVLPAVLLVLVHARVAGSDGAPLAGDLGRDALGDLAGHPGIHEGVVLGLAEHVDEARGDHEPCGVDAPFRRRLPQIAHGYDAVAGDAHVSAEPGSASAVPNAPTREEQITGQRCFGSGSAPNPTVDNNADVHL